MRIRQRDIKLVLTVAIFLFAVGSSLYSSWRSEDADDDAPIPSQQEETLRVKTVVDGDTVELEDGRKVRYIGVNTPEIERGTKKGQCYGQEALRRNRELVEGKEIRMEKDVSETDKYGRLLRYVFVGDVFVNEVLVREGFAEAKRYKPDTAKADALEAAERQAMDGKMGKWGKCR
jgi:micrococcal nuclease